MSVNSNAANPRQLEPGMILWGRFPTHDRGEQWHPAIILRVTRDQQRTVVTATLGTSRRVDEAHGPSEFACFSDEAEFQLTGLEASTRFNMGGGLRFKFLAGTKQEKVIGEISEDFTPTLYRRLVLACSSATL
jgi:hypothetical protein